MSYPPPPPSGGAGQPNPYQSTPYQAAPYGSGVPGGQPPKKDNTLWWILGIIAGVVLLCCCGIAGFVVFVANEASEGISSVSSSVNSSRNAEAAGARTINEGSSATVGGAAIRPGWSVSSSDDIVGLTVRNDSGSSDSFYLTFYFLEDGDVIDDVTCTTNYLGAGESDYSPNCVGAIRDIGDADEIRVAEGY